MASLSPSPLLDFETAYRFRFEEEYAKSHPDMYQFALSEFNKYEVNTFENQDIDNFTKLIEHTMMDFFGESHFVATAVKVFIPEPVDRSVVEYRFQSVLRDKYDSKKHQCLVPMILGTVFRTYTAFIVKGSVKQIAFCLESFNDKVIKQFTFMNRLAMRGKAEKTHIKQLRFFMKTSVEFMAKLHQRAQLAESLIKHIQSIPNPVEFTFNKELTCPVSHEPLTENEIIQIKEEPVWREVSRTAMIDWLKQGRTTSPLSRRPLSQGAFRVYQRFQVNGQSLEVNSVTSD
ncbi:hypothetical protein D5018_08830 [Parashewanella curva]|uniref:Uncharacterized protein n=1 Tax=Parashewanella curva TaxID=2338552 RepID=A0A3L8PXQ4_9GAMM|nr:hypothetical protein [Parashewanella curva]RLV60111.1 hypothetical protein D5018_08830 [Parashewanella curva]